ncbi:glycosyltransferase family protein [Flavobacterium macacae]|uniref:Glycosyltransferase family 1 protein n=1 Tax=Flavobacterium macacae TaxID=2488993 RepID=A0A3P3W3T3_9FLAO|nr:glycosyltransferase [Flavobacterium macacae]RRJ89620.1 glycosyltransferase family 1 protein [Flavobacterium macacae]
MRILLVGEFSRLHNSLKEGLVALGHEVHIIGTGDDFKKFPVDFSISSKFSKFYAFRLLNKITKKIITLDLESWERGYRFKKILPQLKNYDVIQLINSDAIETQPNFQIKLYTKLFEQNTKKFLLVCGDETPIVDFHLKNKLRYSVMTPFLKNPDLRNYYNYTLKYNTAPYRKLFNFLLKECDAVFASDLDYKIPLEKEGFHFKMIPNPVNTDKITPVYFQKNSKIVIFHGKNKYSFVKKGSDLFEEALAVIATKYKNKIEIISSDSLPYHQYILLQDRATIILDQIYSFDQGYSALEAMAKGKVVFTGAETEFYDYYNLSNRVAINALPDVADIIAKLSELIENPEEIENIGKNARNFVEKEHHYIKIAEEYLNNWKK